MVERFNNVSCAGSGGDHWTEMQEDPEGRWVAFDDYDALAAEVLALKEHCAALESREVCTVAHEDVETCGYCQRDALKADLASMTATMLAMREQRERYADERDALRRFLAWEKEVDKELLATASCSLYDLPDCPTRDWFDAKVKPQAAAKRALKLAKRFYSGRE